MIIIGITGSIGMGKTTISSMLKTLKIPVFDSDKQVKEILENDYLIIDKIYKLWPDTVILSKKQRKVDKLVLGNKIFTNFKNKTILEKMIHPKVQKARNEFLKNHNKSHIVGLDVPLLYETGTDKQCDYIFLVNTSKTIQRKRVLARENMTEEKFNLINSAQWSFAKKKKFKPIIINTSYGKLLSFILVLINLLKILIYRIIRHDKGISSRY